MVKLFLQQHGVPIDELETSTKVSDEVKRWAERQGIHDLTISRVHGTLCVEDLDPNDAAALGWHIGEIIRQQWTEERDQVLQPQS